MIRVFKRSLVLIGALVVSLMWSMRASADILYEDPKDRFSMTFFGDWDAHATDDDPRWFQYADLQLSLAVAAVETGDLAEGTERGLRELGIDPEELTESGRTNWNRWLIVSFDVGRDQGVTVLGQSRDAVTILIVGKGQRDLTNNPPQDVLASIETLRFAGAETSPESIPQFEAYVAAAMADGPPGLSIVMAGPKDIIYARGFGMADGPSERTASPETIFQWASITKTVTATAIMQLVEREQLDLDAPISAYLDYAPADLPITARHLLTHSSGLPEEPDALLRLLRLDGQTPPDLDLVLRDYFAGTDALMFSTGTKSAYANPNFIILGELVAARSGMPFYDYVRQNILGPLGLKRTDFTYVNEAMAGDAGTGAIPVDQMPAFAALIDKAQGAGAGATFFRGTDENYAWFNLINISEGGGGGLVGPASEMIRFGQMMLNDGKLNGVRILSPESVAILQEPQILASGKPLGIGLAWHFGGQAPHRYIEHDGGGAGMQAKLRIYMQDGLAIAIMANGAGIDRDEVASAAANVFFALSGQ